MRIVFEKVPDSEGSSFGCFHAGGQVFDCPYHIHPEIEILHVLSGSGLLVVGDHIGRFARGDLLLFGSGLPHMLSGDVPTSESTQPTREPTHIRYVQFKQENFGEAFWQMPEQRAVSRLLGLSARGLLLDAAATQRVIPVMDKLWESRGARRLWGLMALLEEIAPAEQAQPLASVGYSPVSTHRDSERLNRAIHHINAHLTGNLTLDEVADKAGMSPQSFSRFFHKFVGIPFIEYVVSLRISLACRYLLETDKTIAAICYLCGFNNLSNFNRQFLRGKGTTPREFRRNAALDHEVRSIVTDALPDFGGTRVPENRFS